MIPIWPPPAARWSAFSPFYEGNEVKENKLQKSGTRADMYALRMTVKVLFTFCAHVKGVFELLVS